MKRTIKFTLSALLGAVLVLPGLAQDRFPHVPPYVMFPDIPLNHWVYKSFSRLKANGLLVAYHDRRTDFGSGPPSSRYELGLKVHAAWLGFKGHQGQLLNRLLATLSGLADPSAEKDDWLFMLDSWRKEAIRTELQEAAPLNRLITEFAPELTSFGANVVEMKSALGLDQFRDVPPAHWAYMDVLELKATGLLVGYPDSQFKGNPTP